MCCGQPIAPSSLSAVGGEASCRSLRLPECNCRSGRGQGGPWHTAPRGVMSAPFHHSQIARGWFRATLPCLSGPSQANLGQVRLARFYSFKLCPPQINICSLPPIEHVEISHELHMERVKGIGRFETGPEETEGTLAMKGG